MSRSAMTMRAVLETDNSSGTDSWNQPTQPNYSEDATPEPCFVWSRQRTLTRDDDKIVIVEEIFGIFPKSTALTEDKRIARIENRRGTVIFQGPLVVRTLTKIAKGRHQRARLERMR